MRTFLPLFLAFTLSTIAAIAQPWTPIIPNRATYSIAANPQNVRTLYAGNVARIIFKSTDAGLTWEERSIGNPGGSSRIMMIKVHPTDTSVVFAGGQGLDGLSRTSDGGETWETVLNAEDGSRFEIGGQGALAIDPINPNIIYAIRYSNGEVYKTEDSGETWDTTSVIDDALPTDRFRAIIVHPSNSDVLFAGGRRAEIRRSQDAGKTWQKVDMGGIVIHPDMDVSMFAWSPTIPGTIYATVQRSLGQNTGSAGLLRSTNHGISWHRWRFIDTSLYALNVRATKSGDEIFLGGSQIDFPVDPGHIRGDSIILWTANSGENWKSLEDIEWMQNEIGDLGDNIWGFAATEINGSPVMILATEGGAYRSSAITSVTPSTSPLQTSSIVLGARGNNVTVSYPLPLDGLSFVVSDIQGALVMHGSVPVTGIINVRHLPRGSYVVRVSSATEISTLLFIQ